VAVRLRELPSVHLRARERAAVCHHRRRLAGAERSVQASDAGHRALDLLSPGSQWQLSAAGNWCSAASSSR
jgi:hypothetical protein